MRKLAISIAFAAGCAHSGHSGRVVVADTPIEIVDPITFAVGSAELPPTADKMIDAVAATLAGNPEIVKIAIDAYTTPDDGASDEVRHDLGLKRAQALIDRIVARGIAADRLQAQTHPGATPQFEIVVLERAPPVDAAPASSEPQMGSDWPGMDHEKIGGLAIGDPADKAIKLLGNPTARTPAQYEGATGEFTSTLTFDAGVTVMTRGPQNGPGRIATIAITAPSTLQTVERIGIGSSLADVKAAFAQHLTPPSAGSASWLVGSVYDGMLIGIDHDRVTSVLLGAMAF